MSEPPEPLMGTVGTIALWGGFTGMAVPTLFFYRMFLREEPGRQRLFHVLTLFVTAMAAMAYMFMAMGQGYIMVGERPFFYMRYVDWLMTTPVLLLDLCLLAQAQIEKTALLFLMDMLMIIGGFLGALITTKTKYIFFLIASFMYLPIVTELLFSVKECARKAGKAVEKIYTYLSYLTVGLWSLYPVIWILAEGTNILSADVETLLYAIIDVSAKSVFGFQLLRSHQALKEASNTYTAFSTGANGRRSKFDLDALPTTMSKPRSPDEIALDVAMQDKFEKIERKVEPIHSYESAAKQLYRNNSTLGSRGLHNNTSTRSLQSSPSSARNSFGNIEAGEASIKKIRSMKHSRRSPLTQRACPACGAGLYWHEMAVINTDVPDSPLSPTSNACRHPTVDEGQHVASPAAAARPPPEATDTARISEDPDHDEAVAQSAANPPV